MDRKAQPDPRITIDALGMREFDGESYLTHKAKGCPRNALVEIFRGYLRCSHCRTALTDVAATYVWGPRSMYEQAPWEETEQGTFKQLKK